MTSAFPGRTVYPSPIQLDQHHLSRLGPYELLAPLGAGGMGSVYRARDRRLQRDVALKILAEAAQRDPDRQRRFLQEAQAASALNHPNILTVYDVGVDNGISYIAAELIDGQSLRRALEQGPLPIRTLLDFAAQIADGLAAAHEAGIVHRDLKPENVMVTGNGRAKIVDFGLAKAFVDVRGQTDGPAAITETAEGIILGTVPYMSPEQARGASVDYRSDQFSFGVMLYEMATGRQPFRRDSPIQTLSAIISEEPQSLSELNSKLPIVLRWVIERCLAKDVGQRYASTIDLANELRTIRDRLAEISTVTSAAVLPGRRLSTLHVVGAVIIGTAVFVAAAGWLLSVLPTGANLAAYRFSPLATDAGYQGSPAWSPDGKAIAYVADIDGVVQVFSRSLSSSQRAQLTHSRFHCRDPFWAPDGTHIYYISLARDMDGLWSVSATGGASELVLENVMNAAISPSGQMLALFRNTSHSGMSSEALWTASPPGAEPRRYPAMPFSNGLYSDSALQFSPDGSKLGIWATAWGGQLPKFWIIPTAGGAPYVALNSLDDLRATSPPFAWLADSRHIVAALRRGEVLSTHLWMADTQDDSSQPVTISSADENTPTVSPDGERIAFASQAADWDLVEVPLDGSPPRTLLATSRNESSPTWSPTGSEFAFVTDRTGHSEIWLRNKDGQWERPIVTDRDFPDRPTQLLSAPAFSPDGQRLAYQRSTQNAFRIWISTLAGGPAVQLSRDQAFEDEPTWSPDGAWIAYVRAHQGVWTLVRARVGGGDAPVLVSADIDAYAQPAWSPDGRWIACATREGLSLLSPDAQNRHVISEEEWLAYGWAADSSRLYAVRASDDKRQLVLASIDVRTAKEQVLNPNLGPLPLANVPISRLTRVSDKMFATAMLHVRSDLWLLDGFLPRAGLLGRLRGWR